MPCRKQFFTPHDAAQSHSFQRRFAQATGKLAKTDALDATMLARMGAVLELETRKALVKDRVAAWNREKNLTSPPLKRQNVQRLSQIERQIHTIEKAIHALISPLMK